MNKQQWARITALFHETCERPAVERESWLSAHCDDEQTRTEVIAMLRAFETDPEFLEKPDDLGEAVSSAVSAGLVGRRLGAYRLIGEIGRGGMGVVYDAQRDDQDFDRRAAIKILPSWSGSDLAERFRLERRVLAGLDHPGIARLVDSGTTDEGVPYFVMEYVDGKPVDVWCREQRLGITPRVALMERVCDALAYAHQHLVIHRDVKPANLLVTADGQPKLLDFGIAALLSADGDAVAGLTRTGHHSFTPDYASPEQIRGERVTTASDVYSLGVVLYLLLTGRLPYVLANQSPLEALRFVCEVDPPLMSAAAAAGARNTLRGDLDAIVAKALRKSPRERYGTVADFSTDLRAWRSGRPVTAALQSFSYRARRFARRNRAPVAAGATLVLVLAGGVAATAWQARIAAQERDKAQNRFRQVQEFSRSLLFDVHNALRSVPGATESRRLLLHRATEFLDGLASDAGDDDGLKLELAAGYQQLAQVQGSQLTTNLGDISAAIASLQKAADLVDGVQARHPEDPDPLMRAIGVHFDLADARGGRGDAQAARERQLHESLVRELEQRHSGMPRALAVVAKGMSDVGRFRGFGADFDGAEQAYGEAVQLFDALPQEGLSGSTLRDHAFALKRLGAVLLRAEKYDVSEQRYRQALALDEQAIKRDDRPETRYDMTFTLSDLGLVQSRRGDWLGAVAMWRRALVIRQAAADADPRDARALGGVATLFGRLGGAASEQQDFATSAARYRDELSVRERLMAASGPLPASVSARAWARLNLAKALVDRADATPRDSVRASWIDEARRLVRATRPGDGNASVTAGSEPGFLQLHAALTARLAGP